MSLLDRLESDGYVVIPQAISPSRIAALRSHAARVAARAREGRWPYIRTVPKQFPPWPAPDPVSGLLPPGHQGIWGVQHLLHPDLGPRESAAFAECYFGDELLDVAKALLGVGSSSYANGSNADTTTTNGATTYNGFHTVAHNSGPNGEILGGDTSGDTPNGKSFSRKSLVSSSGTEIKGNAVSGSHAQAESSNGDEVLVMELFNMLVDPPIDFELRWHRDSISFDVDRAEESQRLGLLDVGANGRCRKRRAYHAQYNIPLYEDSSLQLVPGSHLRARTDEEASLLAADPFAKELPGMLSVALQPGDIAFYDNDIIHRGVYKAGTDRLTLHGSVGDVRGGNQRAANVLQHAVGEYVNRCNFKELWADEPVEKRMRLRRRAMQMRDRLVELGSKHREDVYLHDD